MKQEIVDRHKMFRFDMKDLPVLLRYAAVNGSVFFYTQYSSLRGRKTHIQLEDGSLPCNRKPSKYSDGSEDRIEYDGSRFIHHKYDKMGANYGKPFISQEVQNPISCEICKKWLINNF